MLGHTNQNKQTKRTMANRHQYAFSRVYQNCHCITFLFGIWKIPTSENAYLSLHRSQEQRKFRQALFLRFFNDSTKIY